MDFLQNPSADRFLRPFSLGVPEDMSRFAVDVLGAATFGQGFGAIEGGFDDTYRPRTVWQMAKMIGLPNCVLIFYTKKIGIFAPEVCGPEMFWAQ